jgi:dGTPase
MDWSKLLSTERIKRSETSDIRNQFESDFGRIIYSPALRRMHDKTQVFPLTTDDNIHSRLTHSNEVMSIGYTFGLHLSKSKLIQEKTGKNELELLRIMPILLQNVCFIHDIGNAPFGHFGETIVSDYFKSLENEGNYNFVNLNPWQKRDFLNYDGNAQGLRVITKLQYLENPFGLNLTYATLASYLKYPNSDEINNNVEEEKKKDGGFLKEKWIEKSKHGVFYSEEKYFSLIVEECGLEKNGRIIRHPLCYLMEAADSIAYLCMDMEDGFNKSLFDIQHIRESFKDNTSEIAKKIVAICDDNLSNPHTKIVNIRVKLIGYFVHIAYNNFESYLPEIENGIYNKELMKDDKNKIYKIIEDFSVKKIFTSREINYLESTGHSVFKGLLDFYINFIFNPNKKYVQRAKSLISESIINCSIEENLIILSEEKLNKERIGLEKEIERFSQNLDYLEILKEKQEALKNKVVRFEALKESYLTLFNKQFRFNLSGDEIHQLKVDRNNIYELIMPKFEDLDDYYKFRIILDFISGMTDQYALNHYQKISGQKIN